MTSVSEPEAQLEKAYDRRFSEAQAYRAAVWAVLVRDFFQRYVPESGRVLDVGCGWGEFINQVRAAAKYGMDLNPASPSHLLPDVTFLHQDCSSRWPLSDGQLDVVFSSNFFEHLPDKESLRRTLAEAFRCLKPGGRIVCLGPNIKYLPGAYWDFWDHYLPLTELSLGEGLELVGFSIERATARFLPYTMATGRRPPMWTVAAYLRLPMLWPFFGRQFLMVGAKP